MEKAYWVPTLVAQACLCFSLYLAFQLGQPQKPMYHNTSGTRPLDLYFISVGGGFRPLNQQTRLLKQMEKVVKKYKAKFGVDISDRGKDDPLMQNGTLLFSSLKIPWYTTRVSERHGGGYFQKKINLHYEKTLDVIVVDTGLLQGAGSLSEFGTNQLHWLKRTLEASSSNWRIVVGFHPLAICEDGEEGTEAEKVFESLKLTFMKFEVNAYLSGQGCASSARQRSLMEAGAHLASAYETSALRRESEDGFLLHRVSALEIVGVHFFFLCCFITALFYKKGGEVVHKSLLHQRGKEIM